jgi:hypothetical protein
LDRYSTDMNTQHIVLIDRLFTAAETIDLPLWLPGGWAIDAKLHRITREHQDIWFAVKNQVEGFGSIAKSNRF